MTAAAASITRNIAMNVIICCCVFSVCFCYLFLTLLTISSCNKSLEVSWFFF